MITSPKVSYKAASPDVLSQPQPELAALIGALNEGYGRAYLTSDTAWYDEMLAEDFQCINSSGICLNKQEFLAAAATPVEMADFRFEEVDIRIFGNVAVIHALNPYQLKDGRSGVTRYTDIWVRRHGKWKAISAQITPVAGSQVVNS